MPYVQMTRLYIPLTSHSAAHLSDAGNTYTAEKICQALRANPAVAKKLAGLH